MIASLRLLFSAITGFPDSCFWQLSFQWKVRLHITLKHSEIAADVNVEVLDAGSNLVMFLHKYFPDTPGMSCTPPYFRIRKAKFSLSGNGV